MLQMLKKPRVRSFQEVMVKLNNYHPLVNNKSPSQTSTVVRNQKE